jgi:hypothetical protein
LKIQSLTPGRRNQIRAPEYRKRGSDIRPVYLVGTKARSGGASAAFWTALLEAIMGRKADLGTISPKGAPKKSCNNFNYIKVRNFILKGAPAIPEMELCADRE